MKTEGKKWVLFFLFIIVVFSVSILKAEESKFRKQFIENHRANNSHALSIIIKQNKAIVAAEIELLINDAMAPEKSYKDKMYLLDIANAMAAMNVHWNEGDEGLVKKIEELQKVEAQKEKERSNKLEKVAAVEKVSGNFVMATHEDEMAKNGLAPVIYPHWVHRSFFRCKVCHQDIFIMKRGANGLSQKHIEEGKQCGVCHNGTISFSANAKENCGRCHTFGKAEATPLVDLSYYSHEKFKDIASRIGSEWNEKNLPEGKLPLDKLGFINWVELDRLNAFKPLSEINTTGDTEGVRDTHVFFETTVTFMKGVLFSHKIHSTWVKCSLCHPDLFTPEVGVNRVKMIDMKDGKSCGRCHGRVAFTYSDCLRCHKYTKEDLPAGTLVNRAEASAQQ